MSFRDLFKRKIRAPRRALVISNCQCLPIASWLTILSADTYFDFWGVHLPSPSERPAAVQALVNRARADYQLILTIPLSDEFDAIATSRIAATFPGIPIVKISNIYFSGLHPDLIYIGGLGDRVVGPLVDYHSRLGLHGFLQGYSAAKTKSLFTGATFAQAGFYDEYARSLNELATRDADVDISVISILETQLRRGLCFFSVNHPTSGLLAPYCQAIMAHLESRGLANPSGLPADPSVGAETLAGNVIFPIYPEIAAHHGLPALGSYAFKPVGGHINPLNLQDFLTAEFKIFEKHGKSALAASPAGQQAKASFGFI